MWTENQQTAIDAICADNLVSAAAGSGKTAVMVERIVNRVLSGKVDIDKLLVVTFTNAAASELKSRLMSKIMDALDTSDNPDYLNRQLMLINNASICTIDSFCLNVIRNNFYKIGLDPSVKIADNAELELIKNDVLNSIFEYYYDSGDAEFLRLVDCYTSKNDSDLVDIILSLYNFTNSLPEGVNKLYELEEKFKDSTPWEQYYIKKAHAISRKAMAYYDTAIAHASFRMDFAKIKAQLCDEKNNYYFVLKASDWSEMQKAVSCFEFPTLRFPPKTPDFDKMPIKEPREAGKKLRAELTDIFSVKPEDLKNDMKSAYVSLNKIIEITMKFADEFASAKQERGIVDFNDVEHMALALLQNFDGTQSDTAKQLMDKYAEIYVDEYQDCNAVQEKLFSLISRANIGTPNMFMVGDMKQSIYGFRGSEPSLFKQKSDTYTTYTGSGNSCNKIILNKNFRSRRGIIDAVNSVFSQIMSEQCGEMEYTKDEYLYYNDGSYEDINPDFNKVDMVFIETENDNDNGLPDELKALEAEAIYVANKIKEIVNDKNYMVFDKSAGKYRSAKYSDIVLLLRSGGEKAETFNRILTTAQIPVYCELSGGYYDSPEVVFLINFLKIIDNPYDDIALLSVMRHPVLGFTDDEFVSMRLAKPKGYFYNSVTKYIKTNDDELSHKLTQFITDLKQYYKKSKYLPADKLLWEIIKNTDYMAYLSFMYNPELRKANVKALMSRAYDFEKTSYKGIFDFIRYVDNIKKNDKDAEPAKTLSDDEDVVRIMTIHKSKGLEFPIVFVCNSTKQFNDRDLKVDKILMHKAYGFGVNFYDFDNHYYYELPQKKFIKEMKYREMWSEEMRVLYVALTRAREKLFITGAAKNISDRIDKLSALIKDEEHLLSFEAVSSAKSYSDWLIMAAMRNRSFNGPVGEYKTYIEDESQFYLTILSKADMVLELEDNEKSVSLHIPPADYETDALVSKVLDFTYPYASLADVPSNMSVTELKRMENEDDDIYNFYSSTKLTSPNFYAGEHKLTAADIGTCTHLVMEKLDFTSTDTVEEIALQISKLTKDGFLTPIQASCIKVENIHRIFTTPVGQLMRMCAHSVKREFGFKYLMDASSVYPDSESDEKIVVQGMIDAYFEDENGNIIIVDYKTDKITNGVDAVKERYAPQLKYYRIALEKALGKKVSKTYLMLLDTGDIVEC